jgi:putative transposase
VDEYTREALAVRAGRSITAQDVIDVLIGLMAERGAPKHLRSDNGPEFIERSPARAP